MIRVAITGNMGSGKTVVADVIRHLGFPVYVADQEARRLMRQPEIIMHLTDRFGLEILTHDGLPDPKKIAAKVFGDEASLQWLNGLVHPAVMRDFDRWCNQQNDQKMVCMESAIVYESGLAHHFDKVLLVAAPKNVMIARVMERDQITQAEVEARMQHQWPPSKKSSLADITLENDGNTLLVPKVIQAVEALLEEPLGMVY